MDRGDLQHLSKDELIELVLKLQRPVKNSRNSSVCSATYVDGPMASTFFASNDLVGFGHMSGLLARKHVPLALMKSDDPDPCQSDELCAHVALQRGIPELRWRPCRSSRLCACQSRTRTGGTPLPRLLLEDGAGCSHAFANISPRNASPVFMIAQRIRASLLASATEIGRASCRERV